MIAVAHIKALYGIEKDAAGRKLHGEALVAWRKEHSVPVLDAFRKWLTGQVIMVLPKSPIAAAIGYAFLRLDRAGALCGRRRSGLGQQP